MRIIVQKFGGTSMSTPDRRKKVLGHIQNAIKDGYKMVVVVSAMGREGEPYATDTLLGLVNQEGTGLEKREQDLLLSCGEIISASVLSSLLNAHHVDHCVLTGGQAGIITNSAHTYAHILTVRPERILMELKRVNVVLVAGFQGQSTEGEITTLGRGGSDTTATALGAALQAEYVDIFTDVKGIMTADPSIVEEAVLLESVTYTEVCNLAFQGAKVIHPRAVELASQAGTPIRVRSTMSDHPGTLVTHQRNSSIPNMKEELITGITQMPNVTQVKISTRQGPLDIHLKVFQAMAENDISVDFISINPSGLAYTVYDDMADQAESILRQLDLEPELIRHCAKVSAVGAGMTQVPGVMSSILAALTKEDICILQSADSHTTIWVLVHGKDMVRAVKALHRQFDLHRE